MYKFCLVILVATLAPSIATAGGGGTKATGTITFKNVKAGNSVYVIVADPATLATTNAANFNARGGKVLNGKSDVSFSKLKAGVQTYAFARVALNAAPPAPDQFVSGAATLKAGQTITVTLP